MSCPDAPAGSSNAGKGNALGFSGPGGARCAAQSCPAYPIHTVNICVLVNLDTQVRIQQGCLGGVDEVDVDGLPDFEQADVTYSGGQTYDSWGRRCRVVSWSRKVTDDAFIRLRFMDAADTESASCPDGFHNVKNQLLKFEIDGVSAISTITALLGVSGGASRTSYLKAGCIGSYPQPSACCWYGTLATGLSGGTPHWSSTASSSSVKDIPSGAEVVLGPIGSVFLGPAPTGLTGPTPGY